MHFIFLYLSEYMSYIKDCITGSDFNKNKKSNEKSISKYRLVRFKRSKISSS